MTGKHRHDVLLVGSVPLQTTRDVLELAADNLKGLMRRVPDGETGVRAYWITSQARVIHYHPAFEPAGHDWTPESGTVPETGAPKYRLKEGVDPGTVSIPSFGYAEAARESYREFTEMKRAGRIGRDVRFQVSIPTPLAFYAGIVAPESQEAVAPAFETRIAEEVRGVLDAVPHDELAIQWDVCVEIFVWEGIRTIFFPDPKQGCIDRLIALGDLVPEPVELGFHLCYGDFRHKHGVEPEDTGNMVTIANALTEGIARPITWIHMPVPRDRSDDAYFAPLGKLKLAPSTELYLGLVHYTDGEAGTRRRMAAADKTVARYGIATECGLGRRDPSTLSDLLKVHARCAH